MFLSIPKSTNIIINIVTRILCHFVSICEPVFIYLIITEIVSIKIRGRVINIQALYLKACAKSKLKRDINILEIPHPGQCSFVTKCIGHGIAKPVTLLIK